MLPDKLFLIGYRGAGKTTVAHALADVLGWSWADSDNEIERAAGVSIAQIFAEEGETAFRNLEQTAVEQLSQRSRTVIALGGGAVLRETNRRRIQQAGPVVWLTASPEQLAERLSSDESTAARRPSLSGLGVLEEIEKVLARRTPIYQACATLAVDTEGKTPAEIASEVLTELSLP